MVEQVEVEPEAEMESQRVRRMLRIRGARLELRSLSTETEAEIWKSAAEPERLRTKVELAGGRSLRESRGDGGSTPDRGGAGGTGSPVELVERWVTLEAKELGAEAELLGLHIRHMALAPYRWMRASRRQQWRRQERGGG